MSSRCPREVFASRILQDIFKKSFNYVLNTSWKAKNCYAEDVFKTSSVRLHQGKYLLDCFNVYQVVRSAINSFQTLYNKNIKKAYGSTIQCYAPYIKEDACCSTQLKMKYVQILACLLKDIFAFFFFFLHL